MPREAPMIPPAPNLEFVFQIRIELGERMRYGPAPGGWERGFVNVQGGQVTGPRLNGIVVPHSGGDWPYIRPDGTVVFDAHYLLQTDDGTMIELRNRGYRTGDPAVLARIGKGDFVDSSEYYMRLTPIFDAPAGPHDWLTKTVFVGMGNPRETHSVFTYWAVT